MFSSIGAIAANRRRLSYDADALAYFARVEGVDGDNQALETAVKDAINNFIVGCKADGIWGAIKASCILAGARTLSGALRPLVGTAPTSFNFVSGDYNRKTGLVGDGTTKYLNTNRAANADPQNSFHGAVWGTFLDTGIKIWMGSGNDSTKDIGLFHLNNGYFFNARRDPAGNEVWTNSLLTSNDFVGASRSSSTAVVGRAKKTNTTFSTTSVTPSSQPIIVFSSSGPGGIAGNYSAARLAFYSIGESINLAQLDSRVSTLITAIAGAIP
jgi:hypothetical protein